MTIHVVNKGKEGEREVVRLLNDALAKICRIVKLPAEETEHVMQLAQRNQNQSAVGGGDINMLGISFEVKRQEVLSVDKWWQQCTKSAERNKDIPVLIYRQNRKSWYVVMMGNLDVHSNAQIVTRVQISLDAFMVWFYAHAETKIRDGSYTRV